MLKSFFGYNNAHHFLNKNSDYSADLDREIGDADHGLNMNRGFRKVQEKLPEF